MAKDRKTNPNSPFAKLKGLKDQLKSEEQAKVEQERERKKREAERAVPAKDAQLFAEAMQGVKRIEPGPVRHRPAPPPRPKIDDPWSEVENELQELIDVVEGKLPLDYTASDEFVEGRAQDCSTLILSKLKRGEYSPQSHVDLHGLNRDEAKARVDEFLGEALARDERCVLIICGRGLRSPSGIPVIKQALVEWLARGRLSKRILAFCSAQAHDGGLGAIYVLLRRPKR